MAVSVNTKNMSVGDNGSVMFSGLSSNIDWKSAVDSIAKAKEARLSSVISRIDQNSTKIKALSDFRSIASSLNSSIQKLYGKVSADKSFDIFESKVIDAATARQAGQTGTASAATDLISASVDNTAVAGSYRLEVLQVAKAAKLRSAAVVDPAVALGVEGSFAVGGANQRQTYHTASLNSKLAGGRSLRLELTVGGQTISFAAGGADVQQWATAFNASSQATASGFRAGVVGDLLVIWAQEKSSSAVPITLTDVQAATAVSPLSQEPGAAAAAVTIVASDSLQDVRSKINGASQLVAGPVMASVITVGPAKNYLVINGGSLGVDIHVSGVSSSLQTGNFLSLFGQASSQTVDQLGAGTALNGVRLAIARPGVDSIALTRFDTSGATGGADLAAKLQLALRTADGGRDDLSVAYGNGALTITDRRGGIFSDVSVEGVGAVGAYQPAAAAPQVIQMAQKMQLRLDGQLIERPTNQADDIVAGLSLSVVKAEPGTDIQLKIGRAAYGIANEIKAFVDAYNSMLELIRKQTAYDPASGALSPDSVLARSGSLRGLATFLVSTIGAQAFGEGVSGRVQTLPDIGISVDNSQTDSQTGKVKGLLTLDMAKLTAAIDKAPDDVRKLFAFTVAPADPRLTVIGFSAQTVGAGAGPFSFSYQPGAGGSPDSFNFTENGVARNVSRTGNVFHVDSGSARGLSLYLSDNLALAPTVVNIKSGRAALMYGQLTQLLTADTGDIANELGSLQDANANLQKRVDEARQRVERQKTALMAKYQRMEAAMAKMQSLRESMTAAFNALAGNKDNQ